MPRRRAWTQTIISSIAVGLSLPTHALNLLEGNASEQSKTGTGTVESLLPIIEMAQVLSKSKSNLTYNIETLRSLLHSIPTKEKDFKNLFDAYSTPVSYKQKFLNNNAFLVYYTQGYDGPNRPNIEDLSESELLQEAQYGSRNDCWTAWSELVSELDYAATSGDSSEVGKLLDATISAVDAYIKLAPNQVEARKVWIDRTR